MTTSTRLRRHRPAPERKTEDARRALEEGKRTVLTGADRDAFLEALLCPPEPTEALVAALKRHREVFA